ncbi:MAG: methylmalonyl-CoA epimerase [Dehalococcoidia bacterium]|nr:methylmalonyl-CoA epimerase [Dehalococcoidia bacterium]
MPDPVSDPVCTAKHLHHVCIAVKDIGETVRFYQDVLGIGPVNIQEVADQKVKAALVKIGGTELEFIQPTDPNTGVAKFLEQRGEGMHHICFEVDGLADTLKRLEAKGVRLIDKTPRKGLAGMIAFLHPAATRGVLIELVEGQRSSP